MINLPVFNFILIVGCFFVLTYFFKDINEKQITILENQRITSEYIQLNNLTK